MLTWFYMFSHLLSAISSMISSMLSHTSSSVQGSIGANIRPWNKSNVIGAGPGGVAAMFSWV